GEVPQWMLVFAAAASLAGCTSRAESETAFSPPTATPTVPGIVKINQRSRSYIVTQAAAVGSSSALVRAPARVAFRDGAVSEVGSPTAGRITSVHVKLGDKVKAGDALITLTSPDAAGARA